jgi:hypothetical protein
MVTLLPQQLFSYTSTHTKNWINPLATLKNHKIEKKKKKKKKERKKKKKDRAKNIECRTVFSKN